MTPTARSSEIIQQAAAKYRVYPSEVTGKAGHARAVAARRWAAHRMRDELRLSLPQIGFRLKRHHTTIWHLLREQPLAKRIPENPMNIGPAGEDISGIWAI